MYALSLISCIIGEIIGVDTMSLWYKNFLGDSNYANMIQNKKGYFRYEIKLISDVAIERLVHTYGKNFEPNLHKIISIEELYKMFKDHWIQDNGGKELSGKIYVDTEFEFKEALENLREITKINLKEKCDLTENKDYLFLELGYINCHKPLANFNDNYWLIK